MIDFDKQYMQMALSEAQKAYDMDEVPVGAIIVSNNKIIGKGHNQVELLNDSTAHAEMIALTSAFQNLNSKYLPECTIYITLEPCIMCSGALYWSKIGRIVFAASDPNHGFNSIGEKSKLIHPKTSITSGIMEYESIELLKSFFKMKRQ